MNYENVCKILRKLWKYVFPTLKKNSQQLLEKFPENSGETFKCKSNRKFWKN